MRKYKSVWLEIKEDLKFLKQKYNVNYARVIIANRGFHSLLFYRSANYLWRLRIPLIPLILTRIIQVLYGIDTIEQLLREES